MNDWISAKDQLPDTDDEVIIAGTGAKPDEAMQGSTFGYYDTSCGCWLLDGFSGIENVTHWMPLPKPPAESECL